MSNNLPLSTFLELYSKGEKLIMYLHEGNNREWVLCLLKNIIRHQLTEAMRINFGFQLWKKSSLNILLQEVTKAYPNFEASTLTMTESTRLCNALNVIQCMASHPIARVGIVRANILHYVLPFLGMSESTVWPLQVVTINILLLIDSLAKFDELYGQEILLLLLQKNVFYWCLHCINNGCRPIRKAATLILMKILMQLRGLYYCCALPVHLILVIRGLCQLVQTLSSEIPCSQHLKYVVQCFLSLSQVAWDRWVYDTVRTYFPQQLTDGTFRYIIHDDPEIPDMLLELVFNLNHPPSE